MPNTALALTLGGVAVLLQARRPVTPLRRLIALACALAVLGIGMTTLLEYALGDDFGIDVLLPGKPLDLDVAPGRPSPPTALALTLLGAALACFDVALGALRPREWFSFGALTVGFAAAVAIAHGAGRQLVFGHTRVVGVSFHASMGLLALGTAALLVRPEEGHMRQLRASTPGALLFRLLLGPAVLAPLLAGLLIDAFTSAVGLHDLPVILALLSTGITPIALGLVVLAAIPLNRSHRALEASRGHVRDVLEQASDGIFIADVMARFRDVNAAACRLLGYSREDLLGMSIVDLLSAQDLPRLELVREHLLHGGVHRGEWRLRRKDGTFVPVEVSSKILEDGRWQAFVRDISEQLRSEEALRDARNFLQSVLDSATESAILAEDLERRLVLWNEGAYRMFGRPPSAVLGLPLGPLLLWPESQQSLEALRAQALSEGRSVGAVRLQGPYIADMRVRAVVTRRCDGEGRPVGFLLILNDITREQRLLGHQELLGRVSEAIAMTREPQETMDRVLRAVVPGLADACGVVLVKGGQAALELFHADVDKPGASEALRRSELTAPSSLAWQAFNARTPRTELIPSPADGPSPDRAEAATAMGTAGVPRPKSVIAVPLLVQERCLGAMVFVVAGSTRPRFDHTDLAVAMEVARRAALALENANLYESLRLQATMASHLPEGIVLTRVRDAAIVYTNARFDELLGYEPGELLDKHIAIVNAPTAVSPQGRASEIIDVLNRTGAWHGEVENRRKDGSSVWCYASVSSFEHPQFGTIWISVHTDISDRKRLEEENARSLREKEVLLREVHHRVKNNLQVVSSLFYLQSRATEDARARQILEESRDRVQSMALVHDLLYRSTTFSAVPLEEYLRSLVAGLASTYGAARRGIAVHIGGQSIRLSIEQAIPCGMLVSELLTNAFKHAFPDGHSGTISVHASQGPAQDVTIEVADDGAGLPPGFNWRTTRSLGMQLVHSLTKQLGAWLELDATKGTRFVLRFSRARARDELEGRHRGAVAPRSPSINSPPPPLAG